jgi:hypothetical protein
VVVAGAAVVVVGAVVVVVGATVVVVGAAAVRTRARAALPDPLLHAASTAASPTARATKGKAWWRVAGGRLHATRRYGTRPVTSTTVRPAPRRAGPVLAVVVGLVFGALLTACSSSGSGAARAAAHRVQAATTAPPTAPSTTGAPATTAAPTTTTALPTTASPATTDAPAFVGTVDALTADQVAATWRPGCPVGPDELRLLHLGYWGFDGAAHVGTMVVNASVAQDVVTVFGTLYRERFPIRSMVPEDAYAGSDPQSMAADNTSGFNCRDAVAPGPPQWSVHAYGEAIDVNPVENPYLEGGAVQPAGGGAFLDRGNVRPGMAVAGGTLVDAFASVGWLWGGRWTDSPDYQHFSKTGG